MLIVLGYVCQERILVAKIHVSLSFSSLETLAKGAGVSRNSRNLALAAISKCKTSLLVSLSQKADLENWQLHIIRCNFLYENILLLLFGIILSLQLPW